MGTLNNVKEVFSLLGYSYIFIRVSMNPLVMLSICTFHLSILI